MTHHSEVWLNRQFNHCFDKDKNSPINTNRRILPNRVQLMMK